MLELYLYLYILFYASRNDLRRPNWLNIDYDQLTTVGRLVITLKNKNLMNKKMLLTFFKMNLNEN